MSLLIFFFILLALSAPIGIAIGASSLLAVSTSNMTGVSYVVRTIVTAYDSFPILAIPLFILAGELMSKGGISERLFDLARTFVGRFTGGVPMAVTVACLFFGALSGSGPADTAAIGAIMIPAMVKMGYSTVFSATLVAAAGGLAIIMPPSIPMVMFGVTTSTSIGDLFTAGIIPAFIITGLLMIYCNIYCRYKGYTNQNLKLTESKKPWIAIRRSVLALFTPVIILGGIYGGIFTPTEAAGVAVFYALFISLFVYREIKAKDLIGILRSVVITLGPIMMIYGFASLFSKVLAGLHIPEAIAGGILSISGNRIIILLLVNILLIIVGMLMDQVSAILILSPVLLQIGTQLGMHPVHFGLIVIVNLAIGFITPPMAMNIFIVSTISGESIENLSKGIVIPILTLLIGLLLITCIPELTLTLIQR